MNQYFATYEIGGTLVNIWHSNGSGAGSYSVGPIRVPCALGPRFFAFRTDSGVFCIDAETRQTWGL